MSRHYELKTIALDSNYLEKAGPVIKNFVDLSAIGAYLREVLGPADNWFIRPSYKSSGGKSGWIAEYRLNNYRAKLYLKITQIDKVQIEIKEVLT